MRGSWSARILVFAGVLAVSSPAWAYVLNGWDWSWQDEPVESP